MTKEIVAGIITAGMIANGINDPDGNFEGYEMEEAFGYSSCESFEFEEVNYKVNEEEHFGGEGQGDEMWKVFSITDTKTDKVVTNVRVTGYYDSWNGTEWDGQLDIVESYEVKVTQWRSI